MEFSPRTAKGIAQCLIADTVDADKLRFHVSEIEPGTSAHPPHTHSGIEAFYVLQGHGVVHIDGQDHQLGPNEALVIDPAHPHGLVNTGKTRMRYLVIIVA
jgi:XRE family transcriptional regulator, regulator of sulfur utilization